MEEGLAVVVRGDPVPVLSFLNDPRFEDRINAYASASKYFKLSSIDALSEITFYEQGLHLTSNSPTSSTPRGGRACD